MKPLRGKQIGGRLVLSTDSRPNKYRAIKTTIDGVTFASRREAEYCQGLKCLERNDEIRDLKFQVPFELTVNGFKICKYIADATFYEVSDGSFHVIDVKGFITKEYRLKKKLMKAIFNIDIEET